MSDILKPFINGCEVLGRFELCHVLLMRDANYPWCVLVPDREGVTEAYQLSEAEQQQLNKESMCLAKFLNDTFTADKLNIAALGNVVSQLHLHHIVRYKNDIAWPKPVWGLHPAKTYSPQALTRIKQKICKGLEQHCEGFVTTND